MFLLTRHPTFDFGFYYFLDLGAVEGIVYEPLENAILWTCNNNASINKLKLSVNNSKPEIIYRLSVDDKPRGIDVDSCEQ